MHRVERLAALLEEIGRRKLAAAEATHVGAAAHGRSGSHRPPRRALARRLQFELEVEPSLIASDARAGFGMVGYLGEERAVEE